jgi:hypothetical protein
MSSEDLVQKIRHGLRRVLDRTTHAMETLQEALNFIGWERYPHYRDHHGVGRSGLIGTAVGAVAGFHLSLLLCSLFLLPYGLVRSSLVSFNPSVAASVAY